MSDLGLEVGGQVDDVDGVKGAFLGADTAPNAQPLRNEGDLGGGVYFDAQLARADDGAGLFALLSAFLGRVRREKGRKGHRWVALAFGLHCHVEHPHVSHNQILCVEG